MPDAYQAFCGLWDSLAYQEKSAKKRKSLEVTRTHAFGADGYFCMGQQVVNPCVFFSLPYIQ
jgi:hypothetical protein